MYVVTIRVPLCLSTSIYMYDLQLMLQCPLDVMSTAIDHPCFVTQASLLAFYPVTQSLEDGQAISRCTLSLPELH